MAYLNYRKESLSKTKLFIIEDAHMSISKKMYLFIALAITIPMASFCSQAEQPQTTQEQSDKPQTPQFDIARILKAAGKQYNNISDKIESVCNPVQIFAVGTTALALGRKRAPLLLPLGIIYECSSDLNEAIKQAIRDENIASEKLENEIFPIERAKNESSEQIAQALSKPNANDHA